jgi:hypothetical protein
VEADALALTAEAEQIEGHRVVSLGEQRLEGDGVEPPGPGVEVGKDLGAGVLDRGGPAPSPRPPSRLLPGRLSVEGDLDPQGPGEAERVRGGVVAQRTHLEGELLGLADEGVTGDRGGDGGQQPLALQGRGAASGADGAVGGGDDLGRAHRGGGEAGEGEGVSLLDPEDAGVASDQRVEDDPFHGHVGGAGVSALVEAGHGDLHPEGGLGGDEAGGPKLHHHGVLQAGDKAERRLLGTTVGPGLLGRAFGLRILGARGPVIGFVGIGVAGASALPGRRNPRDGGDGPVEGGAGVGIDVLEAVEVAGPVREPGVPEGVGRPLRRRAEARDQ